jgi:hypothetical protein
MVKLPLVFFLLAIPFFIASVTAQSSRIVRHHQIQQHEQLELKSQQREVHVRPEDLGQGRRRGSGVFSHLDLDLDLSFVPLQNGVPLTDTSLTSDIVSFEFHLPSSAPLSPNEAFIFTLEDCSPTNQSSSSHEFVICDLFFTFTSVPPSSSSEEFPSCTSDFDFLPGNKVVCPIPSCSIPSNTTTIYIWLTPKTDSSPFNYTFTLNSSIESFFPSAKVIPGEPFSLEAKLWSSSAFAKCFASTFILSLSSSPSVPPHSSLGFTHLITSPPWTYVSNEELKVYFTPLSAGFALPPENPLYPFDNVCPSTFQSFQTAEGYLLSPYFFDLGEGTQTDWLITFYYCATLSYGTNVSSSTSLPFGGVVDLVYPAFVTTVTAGNNPPITLEPSDSSSITYGRLTMIPTESYLTDFYVNFYGYNYVNIQAEDGSVINYGADLTVPNTTYEGELNYLNKAPQNFTVYFSGSTSFDPTQSSVFEFHLFRAVEEVKTEVPASSLPGTFVQELNATYYFNVFDLELENGGSNWSSINVTSCLVLSVLSSEHNRFSFDCFSDNNSVSGCYASCQLPLASYPANGMTNCCSFVIPPACLESSSVFVSVNVESIAIGQSYPFNITLVPVTTF